jgi:ribosomal protein L11 methyltransferase
MVAGWYRRSPAHAPAPAGVRELVQAPGEGFGPGGHATTRMCLEALERAPAGPALDAGCGSGLLAQAWTALGRGAVLACDLDPRALAQAARSLEAAGRAERVTLRRTPVGALAASDIAGRVLLANVPLDAHRALLGRVGAPPAAAVLSGVRPEAVDALVDAWGARGLRMRACRRDGGFACLEMVRG